MRIEIDINRKEGQDDVLMVQLFDCTEDDEQCYHCASTVPDDRTTLISLIEQNVNECLHIYKLHKEIISYDH
jgi:hypothetical protein